MPAAGDAGSDGVNDAPVDSFGCVPTTNHDEDVDGLKDNCDACPTVAGGFNDTDGDLLSDGCDPDLSTSVDGDRILLASVFASSTELSTTYDTAGTAAVTISNDRVVIPAGGQIQTKAAMIPTQIVAQVGSFTGLTATDVLGIAANGVSCEIGARGCSGETSKICVSFNAVGVTRDVAVTAITRVTVSHDLDGLHCTIDSNVPAVTVDAPGQFINSIPFVRTTGADVMLDNLTFYGER